MDRIRLVVNGDERIHSIEPSTLLVDFLREYPGIGSVKWGCDTSQCGTCMVLVGGVAVKSCTMFAIQADGSTVETAEGLIRDGSAEDLYVAFQQSHAGQCGYCMGGMIVAAEALLRVEPEPREHDIRRGLDGNLCRCSDYRPFVDAVARAAESRRAARPASPGRT